MGAYLGEEGKRSGVRAKVSSWRRISPDSLIPHAKASGQYLNSILAKIESHKAGYEEAILLDDLGSSARARARTSSSCGTASSPRRRRPRRSSTGSTARPRSRSPATSASSSSSATSRAPSCTWPTRSSSPGTAAELVPVVEIDDHRIGDGTPATVTRAVQALRSTTRCTAATERYREWLEPGASARAGPARDRTVELYDATLRDGMQGQGMSLSAREKVRVAHKLDELGVHLIEAGFPASNPKELELFELLAARAASSTRRSPRSA